MAESAAPEPGGTAAGADTTLVPGPLAGDLRADPGVVGEPAMAAAEGVVAEAGGCTEPQAEGGEGCAHGAAATGGGATAQAEVVVVAQEYRGSPPSSEAGQLLAGSSTRSLDGSNDAGGTDAPFLEEHQPEQQLGEIAALLPSAASDGSITSLESCAPLQSDAGHHQSNAQAAGDPATPARSEASPELGAEALLSQPPPPPAATPIAAAPIATSAVVAESAAADDVDDVDELDMRLSVKDGGMALLCALAPADCEWRGGSAGVDVRAHGRLSAPAVEGRAVLSRGQLFSPLLRYPVSNLSASIKFDGANLVAQHVTADLGRQGSLRMSGTLPLQPPGVKGPTPSPLAAAEALPSGPEVQQRAPLGGGVSVKVEGLDLRVRNVYTGALDTELRLDGSLAAPQLGGWLRFSRGTAFLTPPSGSSAAAQQASAAGGGGPLSSAPRQSPTGGGGNGGGGASLMGGGSQQQQHRDQMVQSVFSLLKAGRKRAILGALSPARHLLAAAGGGGAAGLMEQLGAEPGALPAAPPRVLKDLAVSQLCCPNLAYGCPIRPLLCPRSSLQSPLPPSPPPLNPPSHLGRLNLTSYSSHLPLLPSPPFLFFSSPLLSYTD